MANVVSHSEIIRRLRWRFDFVNKPSKVGYWSRPGDQHGGHAWSVDKTGLLRAAIEAEDTRTWKELVAAECDGHDFINFEWIGGTTAPMAPLRPVTLEPQIIGMRLHTREKVFSVMMFSTQVHVRDRTEEEKRAHLAGFGR
jgi:hypothetical protein